MKRTEKELREHLEEMLSFERELREKGIEYIAGVDEVGRGPLAGPVVTAAVVLPENFSILGVDDSKKLSEKKREELFEKIKECALAVGIGMVENDRIDEINILEATKEAMALAITKAREELCAREKGKDIQHILIDALQLKAIDIPQTDIVKGDAKSVSIAAASIIAKVTRDRMMVEYAKEYPQYGFEKNKGYGTKAHYAGLESAGITPIHRLSFLKNIDTHTNRG